MLTNHKIIELFDKPLFTWVTIETPLEEAIPLPSEACFAYITDGDGQVLSKKQELKAETGHTILSLCGITVGKMLSDQEKGKFNSMIIHFHKDQLRKIYEDSKPPLWKELEAPLTKFIVQKAATTLVKQYILGIKHLFENKEAITEEILFLKIKEI
ncbi:MAG: hypothetical protein JKY42_05880, partial [Flavobacteriales bacterium]|nr:hypothetical protein [Flavobacteriales bacterium]